MTKPQKKNVALIKVLTTLAVYAHLLIASPTVFSDVYQSVGPDGTLIFTDVPSPNSVKVQIKPLPTLPFPTKDKNTKQQATKDNITKKAYESIQIISPAQDTTFRGNTEQLQIVASLSPRLQQGHSVQLFSNGTAVSELQNSTSFTLKDMHRGSHTLSVKVVDTKGHVLLSSPPITIYMHRPSVLQRPNKNK